MPSLKTLLRGGLSVIIIEGAYYNEFYSRGDGIIRHLKTLSYNMFIDIRFCNKFLLSIIIYIIATVYFIENENENVPIQLLHKYLFSTVLVWSILFILVVFIVVYNWNAIVLP